LLKIKGIIFAHILKMRAQQLYTFFLLFFTVFALNNINAQKLNVLNGSELADLAHMKADSGETIVINLWATWCVPCVRELPYFVQADTSLREENFKFIFVSFDPLSNENKVLKFIDKNGLPGTHYIIGNYDAANFYEQVHKKWEGGIPFTLVITQKETKHHEGAFESFRQFWQFIHF
jgi:thiol-disulfide isomerase/thioredoxin